jgi:GTP-binding protein HflX
LRVLNKVDLLNPEQRENLDRCLASAGETGPVLVSAMTGQGIDELLRRMDSALPIDPVVTLSLRLPMAEGRTLALIHALGRVLHSEVDDSHMVMDAEVPVSIATRLRLRQYASQGTSRTPRA